MEEDNKLVEERREKLKALRAKGQAFPNDWRSAHHAAELTAQYGMLDKAALEALAFGEGDTAPVPREVLRQAEPNPMRRPRIHLG